MPQTYDINALSTNDPTDEAWALAWARLLSRDYPTNEVYPAHSLKDEEWEAFLRVTAVTVDGDTYFRPFKAVAMKIATDPTYALAVTEDGYSGTFRNPQELVAHLEMVSVGFSELYPPEVNISSYKLVPRF